MEFVRWTPGSVKLLLSPRQSRGITLCIQRRGFKSSSTFYYEMMQIRRGKQKEMLVEIVTKKALECSEELTFDEFKDFVGVVYTALETGIFDYEKPTRD